MMLFPALSRRKPDAAERDRIGRAWQDRLVSAAPSSTPVVVFAIPLIARKRARNWDVVRANLAMTLASLRQQTAPDWVAYVCGQDRPEGIAFDAQVRFVPFRGIVFRPNEKGVRGWDKGDKRRRLLRQVLRDFRGRDGYYAQWDGDDLLHPDVVRHVIRGNNGRGYLVEQGVIADLTKRRYGEISPEARTGKPRSFWRLCGSSSFVRFDFRTQPRHWKRLLERHSSHKKLVDWQAAHGLPLETVPFPAAVYSYAHGDNLSALKGSDRGVFLDTNPLDPARVETEFGLAPILAAGLDTLQK